MQLASNASTCAAAARSLANASMVVGSREKGLFVRLRGTNAHSSVKQNPKRGWRWPCRGYIPVVALVQTTLEVPQATRQFGRHGLLQEPGHVEPTSMCLARLTVHALHLICPRQRPMDLGHTQSQLPHHHPLGKRVADCQHSPAAIGF